MAWKALPSVIQVKRLEKGMDTHKHGVSADRVIFDDIEDIAQVWARIAAPYCHDIKGAWFNEPYTTVKWMDGSTTTVKCHDGDEYDREKGLLLCFAKRLFGGGRYNDVMRRALGGEA